MVDRFGASGQAAIAVLAGMMTLGFADNLLRLVTAESSLAQFHLLRGGLALAMMGAVAAAGYGVIRPKRPLAVLGRSLFTAGAMVIYFGCLALMPIGVVVAGLFTAPLFVLVIEAVFQGKRVGPVRLGAVALGFAGALMVIRPDPAALDPVAFLPILGGLLYAVGAVATRAWCEGEGTLALSAGFFGVLALLGALGSVLLPGDVPGAAGFPLRGWMPLTPALFGWIAVQALGALIGIACIFRGYQRGEASFVAVFEYSLLVFASLWALVLWGEGVPGLALVGMGLIVVSGAVIALRPGR